MSHSPDLRELKHKEMVEHLKENKIDYKVFYEVEHKKFEEALERARGHHDVAFHYNQKDKLQELEHIFPELKKSKDEKIRNEIIDYLKGFIPHYEDDLVAKSRIWIAWLEKQGKQKIVDKVEPKFKVGDWITNSKLLVGQVTSFDGEYYHYMCNGIEQPLHVSNAYNWHIWTIQDAKDGDVLVYGDNPNDYHVEVIMVFKSLRSEGFAFTHFHIFDDEFRIDDWCDCGFNAHPATKEQRELLFSKMKKAGYEWDAEKKELKKIEKKSTWSKEDEKKSLEIKYLISDYKSSNNELCSWIDELKNRVQPQSQWKPTWGQMKALEAAIFEARYDLRFKEADALKSLKKELKKL